MCLGLASGYVPPKEPPTYEVKDVVCDYGVFENSELMKGLILNSRANALLIADILNADAKHEIHNKAAKAEWKKITPSGIYQCSHCGYTVMPDEIEDYKCCHNCGAYMRA